MKQFRYVQSYKGYNYFRYPGQPKITLPRALGSPEFQAAYDKALAEAQARRKQRASRMAKSVVIGTLRANVDRYFRSAMFRSLKPSTQERRRYTLNAWCDGNNKKQWPGFGDLPLDGITSKAFAKMMYMREDTPGAQRGFLCAVRHFLKDCKKAQTIPEDFDPTRGQQCGRGHNPEGLKCWPEEMLSQYRAYWPSGTMQRLSLEVLYESGAACCDVIKLGRDSIVDGLICFDRQKTGASSYRPFTQALDGELAASPLVSISGPWLRNAHGKPFTSAKLFGERFRKWCEAAGLPKGYGAHGVRKRAATDLANAGESLHTLMAEFGWNDPDQAVHYTRKSERKRLAMARAARIRTGTEL